MFEKGLLAGTAAQMRSDLSGEIAAVSCDIRDGAAVDAMMDAIWRDAPLDVLVNNAAATFIAQTEQLSFRAADAVLAPTLHGAMYCTLGAGKRWIEAGHSGVVLSILSTSTITGRAFTVPSAMAKSAILAMTKSLAVEKLKTTSAASVRGGNPDVPLQRTLTCLPKTRFPGYPSATGQRAIGPSSSHNDEGATLDHVRGANADNSGGECAGVRGRDFRAGTGCPVEKCDQADVFQTRSKIGSQVRRCCCRRCRADTDRPVRHLGGLHRDAER